MTLSQVVAGIASRPYASNDFQAGGWVWAAWKSRTTEPRRVMAGRRGGDPQGRFGTYADPLPSVTDGVAYQMFDADVGGGPKP
jgi:hypothetical protein